MYVLWFGLFIAISGSVNSEFCHYWTSHTYGTYHSFDCPTANDLPLETECCGSGNYKFCCADKTNPSSGLHTKWGIIGAGVSMLLLGLVVLVVCSVCCCVTSCPCSGTKDRTVQLDEPCLVVVSEGHSRRNTQNSLRPHVLPAGQLPKPPPYSQQPLPGYIQPPLPGYNQPPPSYRYAVREGKGNSQPSQPESIYEEISASAVDSVPQSINTSVLPPPPPPSLSSSMGPN